MIVGLRGTLTAVGPDWIHIAIGGVTLQAYVPASAIPRPRRHRRHRIPTHNAARRQRTTRPLRLPRRRIPPAIHPTDRHIRRRPPPGSGPSVIPRSRRAPTGYSRRRRHRPRRRPWRRPPHRQPHNPRTPRQNRRHRNRNRNPQRQQRSPRRPSRPRLHRRRSQSRPRRHPRPRKPNHRRSHQNGPATIRPPRVKPAPAVL